MEPIEKQPDLDQDDNLAFEKIQQKYRAWKKRRRRIIGFSLFTITLCIMIWILFAANKGKVISLSFQHESVSTVISEIDKNYDVEIIVEDKTLLDENFSGNFQERYPDPILYALAESLNLNCVRNSNRSFTLKRKNSYP